MKYLLFKRMSSSRTCLRKLYLICMKINILLLKQRHGTLLRFKTTLLETVYFVFVDGLAVIFFHVENAATLHIGPRSRNDYLVNSWKNFLENRLFQKGENFRQWYGMFNWYVPRRVFCYFLFCNRLKLVPHVSYEI